MSLVLALARAVRNPLAIAVLLFVGAYALYQRWFWGESSVGAAPGFWDLLPELLFSPYLFSYVLVPAWAISVIVVARSWVVPERLVRTGSRSRTVWFLSALGLQRFGAIAVSALLLIAASGAGMPLAASAPEQTATQTLRDLALTPVIATIGQLLLCLAFFSWLLWVVTSVSLNFGTAVASVVAASISLWAVASGAGLISIESLDVRSLTDLREVVSNPDDALTIVAVMGSVAACVWIAGRSLVSIPSTES